jgi:AhpD family alkylhydroperoxidase
MTAYLPLLPPDQVPTEVEPLVRFLGALPNSMRAYAHRPDILKAFVALEMAVLPQGTVDTLLKARVGYLVSRLNGCDYCASHVGGRLSRNGVTQEQLACVLEPELDTGDLATDAALRFTRLAAVGADTADAVAAMAAYFTPPQIVEIACVVGFFSWTNRVHDALGLPIEAHFETLGAHRIPMPGAAA